MWLNSFVFNYSPSISSNFRSFGQKYQCLMLLCFIQSAFLCQRRQRHPTPVFLPGKSHGQRSLVGCSPWGFKELDMTERLHFHALEKEVATHSSVLAWRIPGMAEPGVLPSMGSHRVGHDWSDLTAAAAAFLYIHFTALHTFYTWQTPPHPFMIYSGHLLCKASLDIALLQYRRDDYNIPCLYLSLLWQPYSPNLNTLTIFVNDLTTFSFNRDKFLRKS